MKTKQIFFNLYQITEIDKAIENTSTCSENSKECRAIFLFDSFQKFADQPCFFENFIIR